MRGGIGFQRLSRNFRNPISRSLITQRICDRNALATCRQSARAETLTKRKSKCYGCDIKITLLCGMTVETAYVG